MSYASISNEELNLSLGLSTNHAATRGAGRPGPKIFSCNFCMRKFSSSQALGGHQNAHKRERGAVRKFQMGSSLGVGPHSILHKPARAAVGEPGSRLGFAWGPYGPEEVTDIMWPGSFYLDQQTYLQPSDQFMSALDLTLKL